MVLRHILKHLRQRRLLSPYNTILARTGFQVEHPLITEFHRSVVIEGDWKNAELVLEKMAQASLFDAYLQSCQPHSSWKRLHGTDADGDIPSPRGGHAMCIDHVGGVIYIFGGWDGEKSLDDFWSYDIKQGTWQVISNGTTGALNAPGARSCHKMVFDPKTGSIYVLGRLSDADGLKPVSETTQSRVSHRDNSTSTVKATSSEFYRYHTRGSQQGKWELLVSDAV